LHKIARKSSPFADLSFYRVTLTWAEQAQQMCAVEQCVKDFVQKAEGKWDHLGSKGKRKYDVETFRE